MPLINILVTLAIVGFALWAVNKFIPMAGRIKAILNLVVAIVVCLWLLQVFGIIGSIRGIRVE